MPIRDFLAVDAGAHNQIVRIGNFIWGDQRRTDRVAAIKVLALGGTEPPSHFSGLDVAGGEVVENRVTADVIASVLLLDVASLFAQKNAALKFPVKHCVTVAGNGHARAVSHHVKAVALVINGSLIPEAIQSIRRSGPSAKGAVQPFVQRAEPARHGKFPQAVEDVLLEYHEFTDGLRSRHRRQQFDFFTLDQNVIGAA